MPALLASTASCGRVAHWMLLARRGELWRAPEPLYLAVQGHAGESAAFMTCSFFHSAALPTRAVEVQPDRNQTQDGV